MTRIGTIKASPTLRVRKGPGLDEDSIDSIPDGSEVEILDQREGWYEVSGPSKGGGSCRGWVSADYVAIFKLRLRTGQTHRVKGTPKKAGRSVQILEMEDIHFGHDSVLFLPGGLRTGNAAADELSGLSVIRASLAYLKNNSDYRMLVVGHADTVGDDAYNLKLSQDRARNVLHLIRGERQSWVDLSLGHHQPKDIQAILKWISSFGWPTDPGALDGILGEQSKKATNEFQAFYNFTFEKDIAVDGIVGPQTFGAFFDVFEKALALSLQSEGTDLDSRRTSLELVSEGHTGCGESHPIAAIGQDNYRSATNRRVEILFFGPGETVDLGADPTLDSIYADSATRRDYLSELVIQGDRGIEPPSGFGALGEAQLVAAFVGPRLEGTYSWSCDNTKVATEADGNRALFTLTEKLDANDTVDINCELQSGGRQYQVTHHLVSRPNYYVATADDEGEGWTRASFDIWEATRSGGQT
jgi:peptidoglycan hydrolase-like protein with peptidoglycan-binding domain